MTTWSKDDLHIAPFREDGVTCGTLTWIWSVVVGDMLYVRAYNGQNSRWYQAAVRQKAGRINAAGMRKEVTFEPVDGPINDLIEDAFRAKYRGSPYLGSMISARARSATVKVMPSRWRCSPLRLTLHIMIQATQSTMKAIALDRFGGLETMKLQMLPVPEVGPNEVLIHVEWAGVGQWDPFEREGGFAREFGIEPKFPYVLGSDGAGTVAAVGDRVKGLKPGDRVYAFGLLNPKGGFYAEYAAVKADDVSRIPGKLTTQQAGAITSEEASMATILIDKNVMVPMRDGLRLATDVHRLDGATPAPVLLARTPYDKEHIVTASDTFDILRAVQAGYAVVIQDVRGRFASEGEFNPHFQEDRDGADTIAWTAVQPWSRGVVGTFGVSCLGCTQWLAAHERPQALRAIAPA